MSMWGIVPAAGMGSRIQPLAFSKELLPVGSRRDGNTERPMAVSEYLVERMIAGDANKICFGSRADEYLGTLVNAWLAEGGRTCGVHAGSGYVDVGTLHGYRQAVRLLDAEATLEGVR